MLCLLKGSQGGCSWFFFLLISEALGGGGGQRPLINLASGGADKEILAGNPLEVASKSAT